MIYGVFRHTDDGHLVVRKYRTRNFIYQNYLKFMYSFEIKDDGSFSWLILSPEYQLVGKRPFTEEIFLHILMAEEP